jgi:hypothetical protein
VSGADKKGYSHIGDEREEKRKEKKMGFVYGPFGIS